MTTQNFMNVVRFKLKSDCVDKYFEVIDKTNFDVFINERIFALILCLLIIICS